MAAAAARYGVSVANRLATTGRHGSPACFLSDFSGWRDGALYPLAGGSRRIWRGLLVAPEFSFFCNDGGDGRGGGELGGQLGQPAGNDWPTWVAGVLSL